jgi:molybdopterin converting factor small subunit
LADFLDQIQEKWPDFAAARPSTLVAINQTFVAAQSTLQAGDQVALMPPLQGG